MQLLDTRAAASADEPKATPTLADAARANLETGVILLCKEALITAIQDHRLQRPHLRVLATIASVMNSSARAWPGRELIAQITGLSLKSVSNIMLELRTMGYLIAGRETVAEANNKTLTVYTFGNIDHEGIRQEITAFVHKVREARDKVPPQREVHVPAPLPAPTGSERCKFPPQREVNAVSSRPGGDSIKKDNNTPIAGGDAQPTAPRKREAKSRTRLAKDWKPAAETVAWARENFVATDRQINAEAEKFYAHHFGKGNQMADWPSAWRTWWLNGYHKIARRPTAAPKMVEPSTQSGTDTALGDAFERARLADEELSRCPQ